ncbi:MAG: TIGR00295 family protein [Nitrospirota bacterium]|nr:MAG: TIGR00295 family protein [Nitrospirota bacterium]
MAGCSDAVISHCIMVAEKALEIAGDISIPVDMELIKAGAVNHDIGRSKTSDIEHAVVGANIAREMGMDERVVRIIERHIGSGITKDEAEELGLPSKNYMPEAPEEMIVAYADNLARSDRTDSFERSLTMFKATLGEQHPAIERFIKMHEKILSWISAAKGNKKAEGSL